MLRNVYTTGITISFLLLVSLFSYSQELTTGFYIINPTKKNCLHRIRTLDDRKAFCMLKDPIISTLEFERVSEMKYDSVRRLNYVVLKLTDEGFKTLRTLTEKLPEADLALVIDDKVVGVFDSPGKIKNSSVPILGGVEILWVYERLKKIKH